MTYLSFVLLPIHAVSFQDSVLTVEQKVAKSFNAVALPVFDQSLQLLNSFHSVFASYSRIDALEHCFCSINTIGNVVPEMLFEFTICAQVLRMSACIQKCRVQIESRSYL